MNEHIWTASGTDIEERWIKQYGWVRPSEQPEYQAKYKLSLIHISEPTRPY